MHYPVDVLNAKASGVIEVFSPYDGEPVGSVECIDAKGVEAALNNMTEVFRDRNNWLPPHQRIAILERVALTMQERSGQLIAIAVAEGGKPYADTQIELSRAIDSIKICSQYLRCEHGTEIPMQLNSVSMSRLAFTHREPIGPVVAVSAFNHPLNLIAHQVGPAIAAGCPIIIKPARETPLSAFALVELFHQAGLPAAWCQAVMIDDDRITEKLVTDKRVAFFSFIGSAKVGWTLRSKLAPGTRCSLEHGGVAPVIIAEDADLNKILPLMVKGGFYHAGQVCVSVQRIYVHQSIAYKVASGLSVLAEQMAVGNPADSGTQIGPLIRHREVDRIESWVNEAIAENAKLITGGKRLSASLYQPTVLLNPSVKSKVSQQEIFGPVICVYEYGDIDQAIEQANALPYAFQAAAENRGNGA